MNRRVWSAVLGAVLVLAAGSAGSLVPAKQVAETWTAAEACLSRVPGWVSSARTWGAATADAIDWSRTLALAGCVLAAFAVAWGLPAALRGEQRTSRTRVLRWARRGRTVAWMARESGMAQDAVRALLASSGGGTKRARA